MSDLLERYLGSIRRELPDDQKADVTAELRDVLLSEVEERQAELGRALTRDETAALLAAFGNPLVVAGRYRKFNQLLGPEIFPFYWFWLRTLLVIALVVHLIVGAFTLVASGDPGEAVTDAVSRLIDSAVAILGWTTLVFVILERTGGAGGLARWNPHHLPAVPERPRKSRFDAGLEAGLAIIFIGWWTGWVNWADWAWLADLEPSVRIEAGPMREVLHWPVLVLAYAGLAISALELARPDWGRIGAALGLGWNLAALGLLIAYVRGGPVIQAVGGLPAEQAARVEAGVRLGLTVGLTVLGVILALEAAKDAWWLWRGRGLGRAATA